MTELLSFQHPAMNTIFTLRLPRDHPRPESLAREAFDLLDYLEDRLSLYREGSDIRRINALQTGESTVVSESAYRCLMRALELHRDTKGYFDATLGRLVQAIKGQFDTTSLPLHAGQLAIDPNRPAVHCLQHGRWIDLGGIGKGFALDEIADLLKSHGLAIGFISAGHSCHLAFGSVAFKCDIGPDNEGIILNLRNAALSASGDLIQGAHIVDPIISAAPINRAWVVARNATCADAWSTAASIMPEGTVSLAAKSTKDLQQVLVYRTTGLQRWEQGIL
jgi:thiamine biosynthesis lipoprotein